MMDSELKQRLEYERILLEEMKKNYIIQLDQISFSRGSLLKRTKNKHHKNHYYYVKHPGSSRYKYVGREGQREVKQVREARYLENAIERIDRDIVLIKSLEEGFLPFDPGSVNETLPKIYRTDAPPLSKLYEREGKKWLSSRLEHQKLFPENHPEHKQHRTSDGIMVKSVSELTLYEMIKGAGLFQVYELPLPMKDFGPPMYPDSTVLSPIDMKTEIIIEYVGRLDLREYRDDFAKKVGRYIACGYKPGVNLFFVFGDRYGRVDSMQIKKVIADIVGRI
ncbi:MAG: hypothetical protein IJI30_04620 [Lachnospiraceae bacterium]|nr:hypothetical protein [Lachnospiraceae bacterium]